MIKSIKKYRTENPIIFKIVLLLSLLCFSSPLGHLLSYVQHLGNKPDYEDYVSQREEYSEELKEYVHHMLPETPKGNEDDMTTQVLSGMIEMTTTGADNLTDGLGWVADLTVGSLETTRTFVADWWWNFKVSFWAWIYGFIIYFWAYVTFIELITIQLHDKIRVFINKLLKTKIKDGGFVFSLIIAVITYFTPFNEVLESAFDIVHYFTHDIFV